MSKQLLYHQTSRDGRGGIPGWWFGAPIVAFAYAFVTPRFMHDIVPVPPGLPEAIAPLMRWFIGLLLGVVLLSAWRVVQWARTPALRSRVREVCLRLTTSDLRWRTFRRKSWSKSSAIMMSMSGSPMSRDRGGAPDRKGCLAGGGCRLGA